VASYRGVGVGAGSSRHSGDLDSLIALLGGTPGFTQRNS
jgi:hypothetical protein